MKQSKGRAWWNKGIAGTGRVDIVTRQDRARHKAEHSTRGVGVGVGVGGGS